MTVRLDWLSYFERNLTQRILIPWERGIAVEPHLRKPLIQSLQRFQVGETGDGVHLRLGAAATGNPDYVRAMTLFIEEEGYHARLLARAIEAMGGKLLRGHWSDAAFVGLRQMAGLHLELMVLLVAEMIAKAYYRALYDGTRDPVLRAVFAQILRDEVGHVSFHCDTLHKAFASYAPPAQRLIRRAWRMLFRVVCLVVLFDHRSVLRAVHTPRRAFWRECGRIFDSAANRVFELDPALDPAKAHGQ